MCLYLNKDKMTPKYATKDIVVYKWLDDCGETAVSPYYYFEYKPGKMYTSLLLRGVCFGTYISSGQIIPTPQWEFSLKNNFAYITHFKYCKSVLTNSIHKGFHSYESIKAALDNARGIIPDYNCYLYKCIIPRLSWYYEGTENDLASDQIIVDSMVVNEDNKRFKIDRIQDVILVDL